MNLNVSTSSKLKSVDICAIMLHHTLTWWYRMTCKIGCDWVFQPQWQHTIGSRCFDKNISSIRFLFLYLSVTGSGHGETKADKIKNAFPLSILFHWITGLLFKCKDIISLSLFPTVNSHWHCLMKKTWTTCFNILESHRWRGCQLVLTCRLQWKAHV